MIRVIFNRKGGVGKSTLTCNLAAAGAKSGKRTLIVDLDAQGNTTSYLGHSSKDDVVGITEYFESTIGYRYRDFAAADFVRHTDFENLSLISANMGLIDLESKLEAKHKIFKLREFLAKLEGDFDEIWLDTPPALNFYTLSALIAAESVLIPFDCDAFSRDALFDLIEAIGEIRDDHNESLRIDGILINQFQERAKLPQQAVDELKAAGLMVLEPYISSSVKVRESHQIRVPLVFMDARHKLSLQFSELYKNICATGKKARRKAA